MSVDRIKCQIQDNYDMAKAFIALILWLAAVVSAILWATAVIG